MEDEISLLLTRLDDSSKTTNFENLWTEVEKSQETLDLNRLRVCIKLLPSENKNSSPHLRIANFIVKRIPEQPQNPEYLYKLAESCLVNHHLGRLIFQDIHKLLAVQSSAIEEDSEKIYHGDLRFLSEDPHSATVAYLRFLKCSYWVSTGHVHYIAPSLVQLVVNFLGRDGLNDSACDVISALFSLLTKPIAVFNASSEEGPPVLASDLGIFKFLGEELWTRLKTLPGSYFESTSCKAIKPWFQWTHHAMAAEIELDGIYDSLYWSRIRTALLAGQPEQRKYCLGILRQSILLAKRDIDAPLMVLDLHQRFETQRQYEKYSTLFEMVVLDRYLNQVQACLPELTNLFGTRSVIPQGWVTALLSAALSSKMQDGLRKLIGGWYISFVTEESGAIKDHYDFLIEGLLPWATQGTLFTSTLTSSRAGTTCTHGTSLSKLVAMFVTESSSSAIRRKLLADILQFVLGHDGRIFQYTVLYLLDGLLRGFKSEDSLHEMETSHLELIIRVSRLTGLPEVAGDLLTAYCVNICTLLANSSTLQTIPGYKELASRYLILKGEDAQQAAPTNILQLESETGSDTLSPFVRFLKQLDDSRHKVIQGNLFMPACDAVLEMFSTASAEEMNLDELYKILEALWDEAERQEFRRPVAVKLPPVLFHSLCLETCSRSLVRDETQAESSRLLQGFLSKTLEQLRRLAEGRPYILSILAHSLRKACYLNHQTIRVLPMEEFLVTFIENPPMPNKDILFEIAAAEKLQEYIPHRGYTSYYGRREWHAYAAVIDLLNCFPEEHLDVAKRILERVLQPWRVQEPPVPIISKWKHVLQLQAMLVLSDFCVSNSEAPAYLDYFMNALLVEHWPRYRYLLEWIISRIYYRHRALALRILPDLASLDDRSPIQIASYTKLAVLASPFLDSEEFMLQLMTQLIPFTGSPKVHIRHEAHWSFPIVWNLAEQRGWSSILENPAFRALNTYIRGLDKFNSPPSTIRTLKLNAVEDFSLVNIFQGDFLFIETPERELVAYDDFADLEEDDRSLGLQPPPARVSLGTRKTALPYSNSRSYTDATASTKTNKSSPAPLQTKSGFDLSSLVPFSGPPTLTLKRPASVILIASLIDNPTNLGGLSRISESFGLEALYINDMKHLANKDFQATAVTSHKHLPIKPLKESGVPEFLLDVKRNGYEVIAIEQTDRSDILGAMEGTGKLPKKCCLVLGSEKGGVTSEVLAVVDRCVEINTVGVTRSLNVQTAGGIAVFEWWREWGGSLLNASELATEGGLE